MENMMFSMILSLNFYCLCSHLYVTTSNDVALNAYKCETNKYGNIQGARLTASTYFYIFLLRTMVPRRGNRLSRSLSKLRLVTN